LVSSNNSSAYILVTNLGIKIVSKHIPMWMSMAFLQLWPNGWMDQDATW